MELSIKLSGFAAFAPECVAKLSSVCTAAAGTMGSRSHAARKVWTGVRLPFIDFIGRIKGDILRFVYGSTPVYAIRAWDTCAGVAD